MRVKSFIMQSRRREQEDEENCFFRLLMEGNLISLSHTRPMWVAHCAFSPSPKRLLHYVIDFETGAHKQRETRGKEGRMDGGRNAFNQLKVKASFSSRSHRKARKKISSRRWNIFSSPSISHFHCCSHHWLLASESAWLLLWEACEKEEMGDRCGSGATPDEWTKSYPNVLSHNISYDIPFSTLHDIAVVVASAAAAGPLREDNGDNTGISDWY